VCELDRTPVNDPDDHYQLLGRDVDYLAEIRSLSPQSDVITPSTTQESSQKTQEVVQFLDETSGLEVGFDLPYDGVSAVDQSANVDLAKFLSRPVRIAGFTWNESDAVGTTTSIRPWHLFFNDTRIKYKLNNFSFMQCKLKIKVMINASPFYYGAMIGSYLPNPGLTPSTIVNDSGTRWFIPLSQRPHMWIYPQDSKGDEMTLPFVYQKNFLNIQEADDLTDMGELKFVNYTTLRSANGATGVGVSVQVYAWAEDIKLSGASVGLAMQSDEYGNGVISAPASAIASGARWFENIPVIGKFATATRIGASAVSAIASLFGFTNVPVISDTQPYRPSAFPQLASSDVAYPTEKLTFDPKNELTVDPSILGLPSTDELVISHLAQKESYLCTATWTNVNAVDDILFTARVNPSLYDNDGGTQQKVYQVPMCWLTQLFKGWRSDIIFRFKFITTPYHKGRVRITYDPSGYAGQNIVSDATSQTVCQTQIVDLGEESDVEIRIPYQQATAFMQSRDDLRASEIGWSTSASPTFPYDSIFDNGTIMIRVQTKLTAPVITTTVPVLVFVRAAENFEMANPTDLKPKAGSPYYSYLVPQADVYGVPKNMTAGDISRPIPNRYLINYGECIKSLRQVLRRQTLSSCDVFLTGTSDYNYGRKRFTRWPPYYGFDANGYHTAVTIVSGEFDVGFNFVKMTPYNWIAPAFLCQRGSMQWTFNPINTLLEHFRVYRDTTQSSVVGWRAIGYAKSTRSQASKDLIDELVGGASGQALVSQRTCAGISVQLPNYTRFRFQTTNPLNTTNPSNKDGSDIDAYCYDFVSTGNNEPQIVEAYEGIGTDFGLYYFINVPTLWIYSTNPTAAGT